MFNGAKVVSDWSQSLNIAKAEMINVAVKKQISSTLNTRQKPLLTSGQ